MSLLNNAILKYPLSPVWLSVYRGKHKWHSKHPRPKPMDRRVFELVTQPLYPSMFKDKPVQQQCTVLLRKGREAKYGLPPEAEENLYEKFLLKQCDKMFTENRCVVFVQPLAMRAVVLGGILRQLSFHKFAYHRFSNELMRKYIDDSKWMNLLPILKGKNLYITCKEPRVSQLLSLVKKIPEIIVLGGLVDDHLLSKAGLERYACLPSMDSLLGETVSVLKHLPSQTSSLLGQHQRELSTNLQQYVVDKTDAQTP